MKTHSRLGIVSSIALGLVIAMAGSAQAATPWLRVEGKYIKDPAGNNVILRGCATIHTPDIDTTRPGYQFMVDKVTDQNGGWYSRVVRIGVNTSEYLSNPANIVNNHLKPAVDYITSKGLYCIIDWHYVADARNLDSQTRQFWNDVAPRFKDYSNVMYEVFNEHSVDSPWSEWKALAQPWVNLIRSHAPNNLILVSGPFYSQHIQGAASDPFSGSKLVYVAHMYPGGWYPLGWQGNIGVVADAHPVFVTEWGYNPGCCNEYQGTRSGFGQPFKDWAELKGLHWTAWVSDYAWRPPMFYADWSPQDFGQFAKDWLYEKRNSNQPSDVAATFSSSAAVTPSKVLRSTSATISATVTCAGGALNNAIVDLEVYNSAGTKVSQQYWTGQNFSAGAGYTYTWNWTAPATAGSYTLKIGVFSANWASNLHWNNNGAAITVLSTAVRRNSGGGDTGWFSADANFSGGTAASTTASISTANVTDPAPAAVYQTERYGPMTYTIAGLTSGTSYTVRLHFAEIYWTASNQRKFHANINGSRVLTDFDIFATAGGRNRAVVRQFTANANSSGQIVIQYLNGSANYPQSAGIEVIR